MNYYFIDKILDEHYRCKDVIPDYKKQREVQKLLDERHSQNEFRNDVWTEDDFRKLTGQRWKKNLELLIAFIDEYKHIFGRRELYALPISCTNKNLLNIFDNERHVSRVIELAQKVDLLKCVDDYYRFNAYDEELNCAKRYICNKRVQDLIIELANKYQIVIRQYQNYKRNILYNNTIVDTSFEDCPVNIAINSKLNLRVPNKTDDQIIAWLDQKYPQLAEYQKLADRINAQYYSNDRERRIQFIPTIKRSRGNSSTITKIGIRATNSLVSLKEHDNGKETDKQWRKDWLADHYKNGWLEFDVKSSIFRINYFLNNDVWLDNSIDLYEQMYGKKFESTEKRAEYKAIAMSLYFERSVGTLYTHVTNKAEQLKLIDRDVLKMMLGDMHKQMTATIGKTYDSEIFLHESCIYMDLLDELLKMGFDVTQVYDGFYVDRKAGMDEEQLKNLCCQILQDKAEQYKHKYIR